MPLIPQNTLNPINYHQVEYAALDAYAGGWAAARTHSLMVERGAAHGASGSGSEPPPPFLQWLCQEADQQVRSGCAGELGGELLWRVSATGEAELPAVEWAGRGRGVKGQVGLAAQLPTLPVPRSSPNFPPHTVPHTVPHTSRTTQLPTLIAPHESHILNPLPGEELTRVRA